MYANDTKTAIEIDSAEAKELMQAIIDVHEGCYIMGILAELYQELQVISENEIRKDWAD